MTFLRSKKGGLPGSEGESSYSIHAQPEGCGYHNLTVVKISSTILSEWAETYISPLNASLLPF